MKLEYKSYPVALGEKQLETNFPADTPVLSIREPESIITTVLFRSRLQQFLSNTPLDLTNPILIVTDKTRLCDYPIYLPLLTEVLEQHGMQPNSLRIVIAYGTHPPQSDVESKKLYGEIFETHDFIHHDCRESEQFVELGMTSRGTPVRVRHDIMASSAVITMGPIVHHYFAGYGGGRKLIFPGCGERQAIYKNHSLYLDTTQKSLAPLCQPGVLTDNPLAEDLLEVARYKSADLAIHGILNAHGQVTDVLFTSTMEEYVKGCAIHGSNCEIESQEFELVVASCGGFPKDINFIQCHKAIHNAAMFVKDGGLLVVYSECRDGIGSETFLPWFEMGDYETAYEKLSEKYEGNGGTALSMMTKLKRIRIAMITDLDEQVCALIGVEKWKHSQLEELLEKSKTTPAWISNASLLVMAP